MKIRLVLYVVGFLQVFIGLTMALPAWCAWYYGESTLGPILEAMAISVVGGAAIAWLARSDDDIRVREGFAIVTFGWIFAALFGSFPYLLSGSIPSFTDAFFETLSGFTTTGASILTDIESQPLSILIWRSQTQWLGGMGIIVLSIAILPFLGVGGMQLFKAEVPGPTPDRLKPRISQTATLLWAVYLLLTALEVLLLHLGGMNLFDSVNHAFTTMATGGFSTRNLSVGHYQSRYIQYVIVLFMFLAGANFSLHYRCLTGRGLKAYFRDREWQFYVSILGGATIVVFLVNWMHGSGASEQTFRDSMFQVVSITTTTGFSTADFDAWGPLNRMMLLALMFVGGCAGSTGGGMKVIRLLLLLKHGKTELKKLLHPQAVVLVKVNKIRVRPEVMLNVLGFFSLYIALFLFFSFVMAGLGMDIVTATSSVAATLGNIGPGLAGVGPMQNYAAIPELGKWMLSLCMLLGRLEVFTVIVLFMPEVWRKF
ncbi:MAG: TrkH family potassium uptake protein [Candidatus Glassbacteria bacterium]|nr:TrkH family potassium uptake protein [Candidatus Glassbacteria bacterium]